MVCDENSIMEFGVQEIFSELQIYFITINFEKDRIPEICSDFVHLVICVFFFIRIVFKNVIIEFQKDLSVELAL
uniref:Uncharacterized protein n=1 Tax=Fervidobacterium thailandense TaxID=1008305 RepID=A0A7C4RV87_9BACT